MPKFSYSISIFIELSGDDLSLLRGCAADHYDSHCRKFFVPGPVAVGNGWVNDFRVHHMAEGSSFESSPEPENAPELKVEVKARSCDLDTCMKILEMPLTVTPRWISLRQRLKAAFEHIQVEHRRLNTEDP